MNTPKHIPLWHFDDWDDMFHHVPYNCPVVAIELDDRSVPLETFVHPERCIYLLGAEDHGLPPEILDRCWATVQLLGERCMNVSTAGSIVMYDRKVKRMED